LRAGVPSIGRFAPGSLARSVAGETTASLSSPVAAGAALTVLVVACLAGAHSSFTRRDIL
jgi:hypothetical protein